MSQEQVNKWCENHANGRRQNEDNTNSPNENSNQTTTETNTNDTSTDSTETDSTTAPGAIQIIPSTTGDDGDSSEHPAKKKLKEEDDDDDDDHHEKIYYYHSDHLGSANYITDAEGEIYEHMLYLPYGEIWIDEGSDPFKLGYKFTGKEMDEETGLTYFGARYYDPQTSNWISTDPAIGEYVKGKVGEGFYKTNNISLYSYSFNNPITMVDPDGLAAWKASNTWANTNKAKFKRQFSANAQKIASAAATRGETIDCADVALTALILTAYENKLSLSVPYYDAKSKSYKKMRSSDKQYQNAMDMVKDVKNKMGAISIFDPGARLTKKKDIDNLEAGDMILYDLRSHGSPSYKGHTMIVEGAFTVVNDKSKKKSGQSVSVTEGHTAGTPETGNIYSTDQLKEKFGNDKPQALEWNVEKIFE